MRATLREVEDQTALITQIRREMATSRELITRIRLQTASISSMGPFLAPCPNPQGNDLLSENLGASANAETSFLGGDRASASRSASDLIRLNSVRYSTESRPTALCDLPLNNSFRTTMM